MAKKLIASYPESSFRPPIEAKPGFDRGVHKPHIALRCGFWYAFELTDKKVDGEEVWAWTWAGRFNKNKPQFGGGPIEAKSKLYVPSYRSECNRRNIQLRGLIP